MVQAAYSAAAHPRHRHGGWRSSELSFGEVYSLDTLWLLGVQHPWMLEVRTNCHQLRYHSRCLRLPCMLQQATHDSKYPGCALLGTSKRNTCVLPPAFVPCLFPKSWAVSLATV